MHILKLFRYLPLSLVQSLARVTAWIINQNANSSMLRKTRINLSLAYPQLSSEEQLKIAKESVSKQCLAYAESVKCWSMPPEWSLDQIQQVHHLEILTDTLDNSNGTLIITPHLGTWEIMNAWVHQYGTPTIMYKPMKNESINRFVLNARKSLDATLVPTDANGVKALFKTLKQGGFSVILPDHVPQPSGGVIAPFFNVPCLTSTLASKMAQKTKCKLVGLSCFRLENNKGFEVFCDDLNDPKLYDPDIAVATTALNKAIEEMINRSPADYMWGYKRFKGVKEVEDKYLI